MSGISVNSKIFDHDFFLKVGIYSKLYCKKLFDVEKLHTNICCSTAVFLLIITSSLIANYNITLRLCLAP